MRRFAFARVVVGVGSQLSFRGLFDVGVKVIHTLFVDILLDYLVLDRVRRCIRHGVVDDGLVCAVLDSVQFNLIRGGHQAISVRRGDVLPGLFVQFCSDNLVLHRVGAASVQRCIHGSFVRARFDAVQLGFVVLGHQAVDVLCGNVLPGLFAQRGGHDLVLHGMRGL